MISNKGIASLVLGVVVLAGCGSSSKSAQSTTTTSTPATTTVGASTTTHAVPATTTAHASTPTTTTPATPGVANTSPALSATFVSAQQGYALEQNRTVAGTTDGGHSWHRVGVLPSSGPGETIRYIDAADGFAFARMSGGLWITHDNGATWTKVTTPFATVADLAIARGMIYVVAVSTTQPFVFQIWSTPVAHLVWKRDPLTLSVGAGPDPVEQIVLNGGRGWILDQNRTVIAGARLASNDTWAKWNPPCLGKNGPAFLSASTGSDLVATCNEGVWGGNGSGITPAVYFSHDGGSTFTRRVAPEFGPVLSPSSTTAVVVGDHGARERTTDSGAHWQFIGHLEQGATAPDYGFTSTTQGFIIDGHGEMIMTYDAGASWTQVSLP